MNFEDCKKVMTQYLEAKKAMEELKKRCVICKENICHCNDGCPMMIDGQCKFGE